MPEVTITIPRLHAGQQHIVVDAARFNVLMCGRRFGKTILGEERAARALLAGQLVGWFAPTYKVLDDAWREFRTMFAAIPGIRISEQQKRIELPTGGVLECWSLEAGEDAGRSRKYHLAIIDEAGLVPNLLRIWQSAIRLTLADYSGGAWFLGTPKGMGDFDALFQKGADPLLPDWSAWRMTTMDNPHIQAAEIAEMRQDMPDAVYRQEVLGEPIDDAEHPIGLQAIAACVGELSTKKPVVWGVDLARSVDYTVAIGLDDDGMVCRFERWQSPWGITRQRLVALLGTKKEAIWTRADSTGVGDPIVEDLQRDGCTIEGVTLTAKSKQNTMERLIAAIQQRLIRYPAGVINAELNTLTAERTAYGIRYQALEGRHDDAVIALAFAVDGWTDLGYAKRKHTRTSDYQQDRTRVDWTTGREPKTVAFDEVPLGHVHNEHRWQVPRRTKQSFTESL